MSVPDTFLTETRQGQRTTPLENVHGGGGAIRLRGIAVRIEDFLLEQIRRLEVTIEEAQDASPADHTVQNMVRNLDEERGRWESERVEERDRIQSDSVRLIEAWQRVEVEQRRLLAERSALTGTGTVSRPSSLSTRNSPTPLESTSPDVAKGEAQLRQEPGPGIGEPALSPELAVLQFQQLRREIQQHNRRER